MDYLKTTDLD